MGKLNQNKESYCLCERCYYFYVPAFFAALEKYAKMSFIIVAPKNWGVQFLGATIVKGE